MRSKKLFIAIFLVPMVLAGASCTTSTEQINANKEQTAASVTSTPAVENSASPSATPSAEGTNSDGVGGGETNTNTSVDTSDWLTYENTDYGFQFQYPQGYTIVKDSRDIIHLKKSDINILDVYITNYNEAPEKPENALIPSIYDLEESKKSIESNTQAINIEGVKILSDVYYPDGYLLRAEFFVDNNYVKIVDLIPTVNKELFNYKDEEVVVKEKIQKIKSLAVSDEAKQEIQLFNNLVSSIRPL